ncbi:MAG: hypothetical protein AVDCRST_MAG70-1522 [uncultured Thermomicrobiales bacterium]|uniref:Uncharacterized protein n=1 Tax=uncultured Thermomicrobiales bacterium TaxID=1645740 RepID=A0A6J4UT92_9BACT|nr:MAG: hypothetical protein AVDCRST_MAG70-1522 [uncultured Thermomicrobiales bacterium]
MRDERMSLPITMVGAGRSIPVSLPAIGIAIMTTCPAGRGVGG